jgi:hypothetical protein
MRDGEAPSLRIGQFHPIRQEGHHPRRGRRIRVENSGIQAIRWFQSGPGGLGPEGRTCSANEFARLQIGLLAGWLLIQSFAHLCT